MSRTVARAVVVLAALALLASTSSAQPTDRRSQLSPERARNMETLLSRAYPGVTLDWDREELVHPDGRRVKFSFGFFQERPRMGEVFVIASHAPGERQAAAVRRQRAFEAAPAADLPRCRLSLMRLDPAGAVLGYKETGVDVPDVPSTCDGVNFDYAYESAGVPPPFVTGQPAPIWPLVLVNFSTLHARPDAWAAIHWAGVLDTDTLGWISRLPVMLEGQRRQGGPAMFVIRNDRGGAGGGWLFSAFGTRREQPDWSVRAPCGAGRCKVDPAVVLDEALQSDAWK